MSWQANQLVLASFWVLSLCIAMGFALIGAWTILPFAGIEMLVLSAAFYYVSWQLSYREVLTFDGQIVYLEKGIYRPKHSWKWPRHSLLLQVKLAQREFDQHRLSLCSDGCSVSIGECLNKQQTRELMQLLRKQQLRIVTI